MNKSFDYKKYNLMPTESGILNQQVILNEKILDLLTASRVKVVSSVKRYTDRGVQLDSGEELPVDSVIHATG